MIVLHQVEQQIRKHLETYAPKVTKKYLKQYLRFYQDEILNSLFNKYKRKSYNTYLQNKEGCNIQVQLNQIFFDNNQEDYSRVKGEYFKKKGTHVKDKKKRVWLYYQIKKDFIIMGLIGLSHKKWIYNDDGRISSTKEIFHVNLPLDLSYCLDESDTICDISTNESGVKDLDFYSDNYWIKYDDVVSLTNKVSLLDFIKIYIQYNRLKRNGYQILNDQRSDGTGHRIYDLFCFVNEGLRQLIRHSNGTLYKSIDLVSSHIYWLAEHTNNEVLYEAVKSKEIKKMFNKKHLLTWLNSSNYQCKRYKNINKYFEEIELDTAKLRDEKGMYNLLSKLEGDYVIGPLSEELSGPNFTVHDQIYFLPEHEEELLILIGNNNKNFNFPPVWDPK